MVKRFAEGTVVSVEKSRAEIETILTRYGASAFGYAWQLDKAMIQFEAKKRRIKFILPLPNPQEDRFLIDGRNFRRTPQRAHEHWEQACRQSWRALALVIKAKLEAVEAGIVTFEGEFMMHTVLPDGRTVGEHISEPVAAILASKTLQPLLPHYGADNAP